MNSSRFLYALIFIFLGCAIGSPSVDVRVLHDTVVSYGKSVETIFAVSGKDLGLDPVCRRARLIAEVTTVPKSAAGPSSESSLAFGNICLRCVNDDGTPRYIPIEARIVGPAMKGEPTAKQVLGGELVSGLGIEADAAGKVIIDRFGDEEPCWRKGRGFLCVNQGQAQKVTDSKPCVVTP